ncbi:MAG: hypothetical protein K1X66_02420 [Verrucomicrobiae bacterium]|nr:hypothetical protein [Verrucomicrobiae bacterium]
MWGIGRRPKARSIKTANGSGLSEGDLLSRNPSPKLDIDNLDAAAALDPADKVPISQGGLEKVTNLQDLSTLFNLMAGTTIATNRITWVDDVNGNDGTGTPGVFGQAFKTLGAARTATSVGDFIYVLPGNYAATGLGNKQLTWYFFTGATVTGDGIFDDGPYTVRGHGIFVPSNNANASIDITAEEVYFQAKEIRNFEISGSALVFLECQTLNCSRFSGGSSFIDSQFIYSNSGFGGPIAFPNNAGGKHYIRANVIDGSGGTSIVSGTGGTYLATIDALVLSGDLAGSNIAFSSITHASGTLTVRNARIESLDNDAITVNGDGLRLQNITVVADAGFNSINSAAPQDVLILTDCVQNLAEGADITFIGPGTMSTEPLLT